MKLADAIFLPFESLIKPLDLPIHPIPDGGPLGLVWHFAKMFRHILLVVGVLSVIAASINLAVVWAVAHVVDGVVAEGATPFVRDKHGRVGLDARVGDRGVKLSGGQRQRITIARVILKNAPILVLDEATSALDSEAEAEIQQNLVSLMHGKTTIAIAHRLSTIAAMDRLIVMDGGEIVEQGRHEVLVAKGQLYARLWNRQSGGFIAAEVEHETIATG